MSDQGSKRKPGWYIDITYECPVWIGWRQTFGPYRTHGHAVFLGLLGIFIAPFTDAMKKRFGIVPTDRL